MCRTGTFRIRIESAVDKAPEIVYNSEVVSREPLLGNADLIRWSDDACGLIWGILRKWKYSWIPRQIFFAPVSYIFVQMSSTFLYDLVSKT